MSQNLTEYLSRRANGNGIVKSEQKTQVKEQEGNDDNGSSVVLEKNNGDKNGWESLEVLTKNFHDTKTLPPPLSPTLPKVYGGDELKLEIPKMLSPTLPDIFNEKKSNGSSSIKQPVPQRPSGKIRIEDDEDEDSASSEEINEIKIEEKIPNPPVKRKSFEKIEHFGVHSYKLTETTNSKSLLLTLHIPSYYKNKRQKVSKPIGLGIKRVPEKSSSVVTEKSNNDHQQKVKKASIFKTSSKDPSPPTSASHKDSTKDSKLDHTSLMAKNEEYLLIAKEKKHRGDEQRTKNLKFSLACFLDSIIIYLVGFNYEDQSRRLLKKLYNDKTWLSLISLIDHALKLSTDNGIVDVAGLCLQIKAVVYEHVCKILDEFIQLNNVKRRKAKTDADILKIDDNLVNHFKNFSRYKELSKRSFIQSERYLSVFKIQRKYPSVFEFFENQPERNRLIKDVDFFLNPTRDSIQLPINTGVSLKEICAYSLKVIKQWCQDEQVKYNDWTF